MRDGRTPAGGGVDDRACGDGATIRPHPSDVALFRVDSFHFGMRMNFSPLAVGAAGVTPDDSVVANDPARRVIQASEDRLVGTVADIETGNPSGNFGAGDQRAIHAEQTVGLRTL